MVSNKRGGMKRKRIQRVRGALRLNNIYTGLGIILSFAIAVGGWTLTRRLIDNRSDALMSQAGYQTVNPPTVATPAHNDDGEEDGSLSERPRLTVAEMARILINWESTDRERPHEPMEGQLSMEEAIDAADACLIEWGEAGLLAWETYENVRAYLCQNLPEDRADMLDPVYSYWTVSLSDQNLRATLTINAVTGQIWKASLSFLQTNVYKEVDIEHILNTFISSLDLGGQDGEPYRRIEVAFDPYTATASKFLEGNMLYATATLLEREYGEDAFLESIELSLVTALRTDESSDFSLLD